jgi:pimeloyl-ACP methyl ester carboxylesterase
VLNAAASYPELVSGLVLLNASGQFDKPEAEKMKALEESPIQKLIFNPIRDWFRKIAIGFAYWQAKQPARIRSVLNNASTPS